MTLPAASDRVETAIETTLHASGLTVRLTSGPAIVEDVEIRLRSGEILGLVGESGSGKTTAALSLLGFAGVGVRIAEGTLRVHDTDVRMDESMRRYRGSTISYVPQEPGRALNPSLRVRDAVRDIAVRYWGTKHGEERTRQVFEDVGLPTSPEFARRYPHELSGGQQQRVVIAMALVCEPAVVVLDEPTTGLDVVTQATILRRLVHLRDQHGISMIYVTHDLAVVAQIADRIAVMYAGRLVEEGPASGVLSRPRHPYTRGLLASIPDHVRPRALEAMPGIAVGVGHRPPGCAFEPRCPHRSERCAIELPAMTPVEPGHDVRCFHWTEVLPVRAGPVVRGDRDLAADRVPVLAVEHLHADHRIRSERVVAAADVSFEVHSGSCVALVGESGSGKTTIARAIAGLHPIAAGTVRLEGNRVPSLVRRRTIAQRRQIQLVFQSSAAALNPRHTVADTIGRPAHVLRGLGRREVAQEVARLLEYVRLPPRTAGLYPRELSGGERQRVAIARALAAGPKVILCDEITSALDVSVQAAVLQVLRDLRRDFGLSLLFISHDLGVVATIADEVLVLESGSVCERGTTDAILKAPQHPYTRQLLEAAPSLVQAVDQWRGQHASAPGGHR
jgi:peptide/nickel transport system ATP-binding protein